MAGGDGFLKIAERGGGGRKFNRIVFTFLNGIAEIFRHEP